MKTILTGILLVLGLCVPASAKHRGLIRHGVNNPVTNNGVTRGVAKGVKAVGKVVLLAPAKAALWVLF